MLQRVVRFVLADLTRPWGPWAKLCVAGCASSVAFMEISGRTFHAAKYLWADFLSLCVLLASFLAGIVALIVALTREGTSKGVPLVVLSVVAGVGWPFILMGLVEVPTLVLVRLLDSSLFPYVGIVLIITISIAIILLSRK